MIYSTPSVFFGSLPIETAATGGGKKNPQVGEDLRRKNH
jgi:hypothetical protein